jgi:hypothetical protein
MEMAEDTAGRSQADLFPVYPDRALAPSHPCIRDQQREQAASKLGRMPNHLQRQPCTGERSRFEGAEAVPKPRPAEPIVS